MFSETLYFFIPFIIRKLYSNKELHLMRLNFIEKNQEKILNLVEKKIVNLHNIQIHDV